MNEKSNESFQVNQNQWLTVIIIDKILNYNLIVKVSWLFQVDCSELK